MCIYLRHNSNLGPVFLVVAAHNTSYHNLQYITSPYSNYTTLPAVCVASFIVIFVAFIYVQVLPSPSFNSYTADEPFIHIHLWNNLTKLPIHNIAIIPTLQKFLRVANITFLSSWTHSNSVTLTLVVEVVAVVFIYFCHLLLTLLFLNPIMEDKIKQRSKRWSPVFKRKKRGPQLTVSWCLLDIPYPGSPVSVLLHSYTSTLPSSHWSTQCSETSPVRDRTYDRKWCHERF